MITCSVCGGTEFADQAVLRDELASEWQLSPHERCYVDRQQGTHCISCGASLRSLALADAILDAVGAEGTLQEVAKTAEASRLAILELNEAGDLSPTLRQFPGHVLAAYPANDMHDIPHSANSFDIVVHADMLEHVANPVRALAECRRVLRPNGVLCLTVPTIVGRLTRSRAGLPKSFHGSPAMAPDDFVVHTEFGADMWTYIMQAGFSSVAINAVDFPCALALCAKKKGEAPNARQAPLPCFQGEQTRSTFDRMVSLHFPKAAGSALKSQLLQMFPQDMVLDYDNDPLVNADMTPAAFPVGKRVVHGHFRALRYSPTDAYWMTFLRHPVDNLISIYFFWTSLAAPTHELHRRFLQERPSLPDFAKFPGIQRLMSETYFGGFDMSRFDFIGFHETRDKDIARLAKETNLPFDADIYANKTAEHGDRRDAEQDAATRAILTDLLAEDVAFYERLRHRSD